MQLESLNKSYKSNNIPAIEFPLVFSSFRNGLWLFGIPSWLFGIVDRSFAAFTDGYVSSIELVHLFTASFFLLGWIYLKPEESSNIGGIGAVRSYAIEARNSIDEHSLHATTARMSELQEQHVIRQEYILPFHYICQIYHLLNLKHLETIHHFSLNNLKVIGVSQIQPTQSGGMVRFQTVLDSPANVLRIWRQPIVEVGLTLHTPYTVELSIPVYNQRYITVLFNVIPVGANEHKLIIDIYSNLNWPRPLLQVVLHFAACLTLFEDLPYLQRIAQKKVHHLVNLKGISERDTMWLYRRFVKLHGARQVLSLPEAKA
ncbi:MAG: hypothetical protein CLLPBCKN_008266 [Chroococcidiopsis cubana SAG 39.79]|jgi:hypothetical protein|uniref:Uncharacterized protein n=2 Tax=Chroococcidiopsis TaxID=54298 RepID=K9U7U7_CHRTP|nr:MULTISPECIES: hypothetical protein [Chroococcidiopsis]PSB43191.1 hypothetical protein C7B80_24985 [Cyanosarcina cf. burmensis CCALA 770]AFY90688.1 hypothetical protein Chro_5321 [Chroococcidiopsis thermalis PCC 7203]MDZ4878828.1 hypothetical protein [Chroococcidiopsis cubana SAG 39.79]PSB56213.1 hypothetical protein C7B79_32460 [Chroococcidiopsis cubana CCALA 043]RUT14432.1 hypothetical protein DSM107010_04630 [Chroococcidiopsis cubana SAG 39.79]